MSNEMKLMHYSNTYHIAMRDVVISEFGINPANKTRISKAQYSKLIQARAIMLNKDSKT